MANAVKVSSCSSLRCGSLTRTGGGRRWLKGSSVNEMEDEEDLLWDEVAELNEEVRESEDWDGSDGKVELDASLFGRVRRESGASFRDLADGNGVAGTPLADPRLAYAISMERDAKGTVEPSGRARTSAG